MNKIENKAGVYRIVNTENGKRYYGSSKELRDRWNHHKSTMRSGTHQNPGIKADAAIYGEEAFEFQVLCYCKPEDRKRLEGAVIDQSLGKDCYNRHDGNGSYEHTEEAKAKISATLTGKTLSEEHKANISAAHKGKTQSEESNRKRSAALKGENNPRYGKPLPKVTCPHCGKTGGSSIMKRWHFDRCDQNPSKTH